MSDRKTLRTSMVSGDWAEFFSRIAMTFRISGNNIAKTHLCLKAEVKNVYTAAEKSMDRKIWKLLFFCLEFCLCPGILRIWILKTGTRQLPVTSSVARKEEFIYINMHQSQHVLTIRAQTLGSTHLKSMHVVRERKSSGQWSLSSCNGFRIVPNERVGVKGPGAGLGSGWSPQTGCSDELSRQRQRLFASSGETVGLGFHLSL